MNLAEAQKTARELSEKIITAAQRYERTDRDLADRFNRSNFPGAEPRHGVKAVDFVTRPKAPPVQPFPQDPAPKPPPVPGKTFTDAERYMYEQMMKNQNSEWAKRIHDSWHSANPLKKADALHAFYNLVKRDGPWDHKPILKDMFNLKGDDFYMQIPGTNKSIYYDIWSNIHYGYVGRAAGLPHWMLETAPNLGMPSVGVNDAADDIYVKAGAALFDKYGASMTAQQFHQGVMAVIDQLEAAQKGGELIPQLRIGAN